jgi:hypothetical protein
MDLSTIKFIIWGHLAVSVAFTSIACRVTDILFGRVTLTNGVEQHGHHSHFLVL